MTRVYLETSFFSACVSDRADPASIYRRERSQAWWDTQRRSHALSASPEVLLELDDPNYPHRLNAIAMVADLDLLQHLEVVCRRLGLVPPSIITPDMLFEPGE